MTKEEFNKKWPMSKIPDAIRQVAVSWGDAYGWFIEDKVKLAQDILEATDKHISEVSKQQSISFTEWIRDNHFCPNSSGLWFDYELPREEVRFYTTPQLYGWFATGIKYEPAPLTNPLISKQNNK